eukprot:5111223-Alexandrium_andersonii.AAC.1
MASSSRASWEEDLSEEDWEGDGDSDDDQPADRYESVGPKQAGEFLFDMLVNLKQAGVLSAKQSCILAFWAHRAGASGVKDLAH